MLKSKDIVIVGQQAWDIEIGSNCKNIALELSKYNRILYVNSPLDRITRIRFSKCPKVRRRLNVIRGTEIGLEKVHENLWVLYPDVLIESVNWIRSESLFLYLNRLNNKKFAKSILKAVSALQFSNYFLFNDNDIFRSFHLKEMLKPEISIYYIRDNMVVIPYWKRYGRSLEPKLIEKSDLVLANSEYLRKYSAKYNKNSYYVGQGCDIELIRETDFSSLPEELRNINSPLIGYIGALTTLRLDIDLLIYMATKRPHWNIVLVGLEDENFAKSELHTFPNVIFLGPKKLLHLYRYINSFDVCINPQVVNELTVGNYPRKIDEYLALGKPVVATKTETMSIFQDYVSLASDGDEFIEMVDKVLQSDEAYCRNERIRFAFSHSWENCVGKIGDVVKEYRPEH